MTDSQDSIEVSKREGVEDDSGNDISEQEDSLEVKHQHRFSPNGVNSSSSSAPRTLNSMPKRRRVTRACDECRRKKIKCDGKQPCTHCTVYSYGQSPRFQVSRYSTCSILDVKTLLRMYIRSTL